MESFPSEAWYYDPTSNRFIRVSPPNQTRVSSEMEVSPLRGFLEEDVRIVSRKGAFLHILSTPLES